MRLRPNTVIPDARPKTDDDAVVQLMTDYMTWAHQRLADEFGVDEPPADPDAIREHLDDYRPPMGRCCLRNARASRPAWVRFGCSATTSLRSSACTSRPIGATG